MATFFQRSFAAGELAPALHARADLAKYLTGLKACRNFWIQRHGGAANRSGTHYVATAKAGGLPAIYPFVFAAADASYVIEAGSQYFRFHRKGKPVSIASAAAWSGATAYVAGDYVSSGGRIYWARQAGTNHAVSEADYWYRLPLEGGLHILELPHPWSGGAFFDPARASVSQKGLRLTWSHLGGAPLELELLNLDTPPRWRLSTVITAPAIAAPENGAGTATGTGGTQTRRYVVTAAAAESYEESLASAVIEVTGTDAPTEEAPLPITWDPVVNAVEYYVYQDPTSNNTFGFLGVATGQTSFFDVGNAADFNVTPPIARVLFASELNYPAVNTTFQQRRIFAGTSIDRELVYASRIGLRSNFSIRSPLQDDDAVTFALDSKEAQPVCHLIPMRLGLVMLTTRGEWIVEGDETGAIVPRAISPRQHGYVGASYVPPAVVGESIIFAQNLGTVVRDLRFDERVDGLSGRDLTIYAAHLFTKRRPIVDLAYAQTPHSIVWCVREDGILCGLTYVRDEDVWGWSRHDTGVGIDAGFKRVCVIPEEGEDFVYVVTEREVNNQTRRYIERFASRDFELLRECMFLDCARTVVNDPPATVVSGLAHLEQRTVTAFADGVKRGPFQVINGAINLPVAAALVHVGLPIVAELETLALDYQGSPVRDRKKLVKALGLLLENSTRGFYAGPNVAGLQLQRGEPHEVNAGPLVTGRQEISLVGTYDESGHVLIRHTDPTPLTILALLPWAEIGG